MNYLQNVYIDIDGNGQVPGMGQFLQALERAGMKVYVGQRAGQTYQPGAGCEKGVPAYRPIERGGKAVQTYRGKSSDRKAVQKPFGCGGGDLYITDNESYARKLSGEGKAVAAYLHEGNAGSDFYFLAYVIEGFEDMDALFLEKIYRRLAGLPWHILDTERCRIRETTVQDVAAFYVIYEEPAITRYMEDLFPDREEELRYTEEYIDKIYGFYGFGMWTVEGKSTGEVIGRAGLSMREGYEEPELGFVIALPWQGMGIAYEVCLAILAYGREELGFSVVQVLVEPENEVSVSLCRKLGFQEMDRIVCREKVYRRMLSTLV